MLRRLRIKNLAVVEEVEWELGKGFNVLTGETGAGKSILIDAFLLLLGETTNEKRQREEPLTPCDGLTEEPRQRGAEISLSTICHSHLL